MQMLVSDGRGGAPPLHVHHREDETFYVLEGKISVLVGEERFEAGPGDFVFGPRGVPHAFLVRSERAKFLVTFTPAGIERFFADVAVPVAGKPAPDPVAPDVDAWTRRMADFEIEIVGPPPTLD
jgi:mannose-6-phosphate isomerase-like protein (cupin superfamily)